MVECRYGTCLIEMCVSTDLKIANGRVLGDPMGRYTCHKYNGSSLVDYVLVDKTILSQIRYLTVHELMGDLTDHCLVSFGLAIKTVTLVADRRENLDYKPISRKFKWENGVEPLLA